MFSPVFKVMKSSHGFIESVCVSQRFSACCYTRLVGGGGILASLRPSVCPSVRPASVPRLSRISCPLCSFYSSGWFHFIFIHLIKQLQKVCRVQSFMQNLKFWQFFKICNFDFVLFWLGIWCVIMGQRGVSQNAGVLVVLVISSLFQTFHFRTSSLSYQFHDCLYHIIRVHI